MKFYSHIIFSCTPPFQPTSLNPLVDMNVDFSFILNNTIQVLKLITYLYPLLVQYYITIVSGPSFIKFALQKTAIKCVSSKI